MPHPVRGIASSLVSRMDCATTWSGEFLVTPPVPPDTLVEFCVDRTFFYRASENDGHLWTDLPGSPHDVAHGRLYYALDPVPEPAAPPPTRFHTVGLFVQLESPLSPVQLLCYDTDINTLPLVGHFELSRFPFFPPNPAFPFACAFRATVRVCCENDSADTWTQRFSVTWRNGSL